MQPKTVKSHIEIELEDWAKFGVEGHFEGRNPWFGYHKQFEGPVSRLVGALPHEVVVMNALTVNLHLLMTSFYNPTPERRKILIEASAFPSDYYAVESQIRNHGYDPETDLIEVVPRDGEYTIRTEDLLEKIRTEGKSIALILIGGVNYYTGQVFDMKAITKVGHDQGCKVGFDLAHAAGNLLVFLYMKNGPIVLICQDLPAGGATKKVRDSKWKRVLFLNTALPDGNLAMLRYYRWLPIKLHWKYLTK